jgi:hypothetical protein
MLGATIEGQPVGCRTRVRRDSAAPAGSEGARHSAPGDPAVVGSGITAQRLTGDRALALLANAITTGGALVAILLIFGVISGAHLNPVVTLCK